MPIDELEIVHPREEDLADDGRVAALLRKAGLELQVFREVERRLQKQAAPEFTLFEFIKSDEVGLSACIAALLDPKGSHGQGTDYLALFLEHLGFDSKWHRDLDDAHVVLESQANGMRRIDISITLPGNRCIAIENKPWATDQGHQLRDYGKHLEQTTASNQWALVYLCEREPSKESIPKELRETWSQTHNFYHLKFSGAVEWLRACEMRTRPPTVRLFIDELAKFVSREVCGEAELGQGEIVKQLALESDESLRAALVVAKSISEVKLHLLQTGLHHPYERTVAANGLSLVWDDVEKMTSSAGFGARVPEHADSWNIRYEFERAGLGQLFWGIKRRTRKPNGDPSDMAICEGMRAMGYGAGRNSPWWIWYSTDCTSFGVSSQTRNWSSSEEPWLALRRGSDMAERIAKHTITIAAGLSEHLAKPS